MARTINPNDDVKQQRYVDMAKQAIGTSRPMQDHIQSQVGGQSVISPIPADYSRDDK